MNASYIILSYQYIKPAIKKGFIQKKNKKSFEQFS